MADIEETFLRDLAFKNDMAPAANGDLQQVEGVNNIRQALFNRLVTYPGSIIHRPDYGVGIKDFQNSINNFANQRNLALRIEEQFKRDIRVLDVLNIRFNVPDDKPERLEIYVKVNLIGLGEQDLQFVPFGDEVT